MISNVTRTTVKPSIVIVDFVTGKSVLVNTSAYGWRIGIIKRIGVSPYWHEMKRLVTRAYVVNQPGEAIWYLISRFAQTAARTDRKATCVPSVAGVRTAASASPNTRRTKRTRMN